MHLNAVAPVDEHVDVIIIFVGVYIGYLHVVIKFFITRLLTGLDVGAGGERHGVRGN